MPRIVLQAERLDLHELPGGVIGVPRNQNVAAIRHLLHAICQMHICARGIVGLVDTVFDRLNDDLAGVDADTNLQIRVIAAA